LPKIDKQTELLIIDRYLSDDEPSVHVVGGEFGCTGDTVAQVLSRNGVKARRGKWTKDEDDALRELYSRFEETMFIESISKDMGRSKNAIACRANQLGITDSKRPKALEHHRARMTCPSSYKQTRNGRGASTHGGFRDDIGIYVRSTWEANYARYLNWLKSKGEIVGWKYEAETYEFPIRRGTRFYTPDFRIEFPGGRLEYHEVKGYLSPKGRTALKRMAKYHPQIKIVMIDGPVYKELRKQLGRLVAGWEDAPAPPVWSAEDELNVKLWWEEGVSAAMIAERLGKTKASVSVRAARLGARRPTDRSEWGRQSKSKVAERDGQARVEIIAF